MPLVTGSSRGSERNLSFSQLQMSFSSMLRSTAGAGSGCLAGAQSLWSDGSLSAGDCDPQPGGSLRPVSRRAPIRKDGSPLSESPDYSTPLCTRGSTKDPIRAKSGSSRILGTPPIHRLQREAAWYDEAPRGRRDHRRLASCALRSVRRGAADSLFYSVLQLPVRYDPRSGGAHPRKQRTWGESLPRSSDHPFLGLEPVMP